MKSLWMEEYDHNREGFVLQENIDTDTVIVGGGLAGILCSYMLTKRGIDNIIVEAKKIGMGITRNTTAKITAQHGIIYSKIEKQYGFRVAKEYLRANQDAVETYRDMAKGISCDFEEKTAYVYSKDSRRKLEEESNIYHRMKIDSTFKEQPPIPVKVVGALGMSQQAQFHPIKFLNAIVSNLKIYEDTFVNDIQPGKVITEKGDISARRIILATHYPILNLRGLYFMKLYQHRSYVLALKGAPDPEGMYIDEDEMGLSFRTQGDYLLLGGGSHQTGRKGGGWEELCRIAKTEYSESEEHYAWATQDCITLDNIPYIGRHNRKNRDLYVATGFNKWGITGSMVAARLISELITEGDSRYEKLFDPSRSMLHPQLFLNMGRSVMGLLSSGKRCPHMGCALKWNSQEHTWDCPCHGSRFDESGNLIDNPSIKGFKVE